jgi:hypothetical protein
MLALANGWSYEHKPEAVSVSRDLGARRRVIRDGLRPVGSYVPPAGWARLRGSITKPCALPVAARERVPIVRVLLGTIGDVPPPSLRVATSKDLTGSLWTQTLDDHDLAVVALTDGTYDYFTRTIAPRSEHGAFYELFDSIEPLWVL